MSFRLLALLWLISVPGSLLADGTCETANSIPADKKKLGSGTATTTDDGTTVFKGGQSVYIKLKNVNVLGVSYELSVTENTSPESPVCTYKAILPPKGSAILRGSLFAETPISWKIKLSIGPESDAGVIGYEVFSAEK